MTKPLFFLLLLMAMLTACVNEEMLSDQARSRAFTEILKSKQGKAAEDFEAGKITADQLKEYEALLGKLLELEKSVLQGY